MSRRAAERSSGPRSRNAGIVLKINKDGLKSLASAGKYSELVVAFHFKRKRTGLPKKCVGARETRKARHHKEGREGSGERWDRKNR